MSAAYEQLMNVVRGRRSVRRFRPDEVPQETVEKVLEAARWAPSATNRQDWLFTVIRSPELKQALADAVAEGWEEIFAANREVGAVSEMRAYAAGFTAFAAAPVVIVVSAARTSPLQREMFTDGAEIVAGAHASAAMAVENLMLAAATLGLGSCCMTGPLAAAASIAKLIALDRRRQPLFLVTLGFPAEKPEPPLRKPLAQIARFVG